MALFFTSFNLSTPTPSKKWPTIDTAVIDIKFWVSKSVGHQAEECLTQTITHWDHPGKKSFEDQA